MTKSPFLQFFLSLSLFLLNPSISKTVRGISLKFCIHKLGLMTRHAAACQNVCKQCSLCVNNNNALL